MLIQLTPEQISRYYDDIEAAIKAAALAGAEISDTVITATMGDVAEGRYQVWVMVEWPEADAQVKVLGMLVTTVFYPGPHLRTLAVVAACGYAFVPQGIWADAIETLRRFAQGLGCSHISGYSNVAPIIKTVEALGGRVDTRLLLLEV